MYLEIEQYNQIINGILSFTAGGSIDTEKYVWVLNPFKPNFLFSNFHVNVNDNFLPELIYNKFKYFFNMFHLDTQDLIQRDGQKMCVNGPQLDSLIVQLRLNFTHEQWARMNHEEQNLMKILKLAQEKIITMHRMALIKKDKMIKRRHNISEKKGLHKFITFGKTQSHINDPHLRKAKKSPSRKK